MADRQCFDFCSVKTELGKKCKNCGNDETYYIIHGTIWYFVKKSTGLFYEK